MYVPFWLQKSELYQSGEYYNLQIMELDNIIDFTLLLSIIDTWKVYRPYPIEIYLFLLKLDENNLPLYNNKDFRDIFSNPYCSAIINNNTELMTYLKENNYEMNIIFNPSYFNNEEYMLNIINWLIQYNYNFNDEFCDIYYGIISCGFLSVIKLVYPFINKDNYDQAYLYACDNLIILNWLYSENFPKSYSNNEIDNLIENNFNEDKTLEILKWFIEHNFKIENIDYLNKKLKKNNNFN